MTRAFGLVVGVLALVLGVIIVARGIAEHGSWLYDLVGVLFVALGVARLWETRRRRS